MSECVESRIVRVLGAASELRLMAQDALAFCAALRADRGAYDDLRPRAPRAAPYLRVQMGYFRGLAMQALGDPRADRVLAAVERYSRAHGLSEWEVKASLRRAEPALAVRPGIETPVVVRDGLETLEKSLV